MWLVITYASCGRFPQEGEGFRNKPFRVTLSKAAVNNMLAMTHSMKMLNISLLKYVLNENGEYK